MTRVVVGAVEAVLLYISLAMILAVVIATVLA